MFKKILKFKNFSEMLNYVNLKDINPTSKCIEDSLNIYLKPSGFYSKEREEKLGVIAIYLT